MYQNLPINPMITSNSFLKGDVGETKREYCFTDMASKRSALTHVSQTEKLIDLWLVGKSKTTVDVYRRAALSFLEFIGKPLDQVTLPDLLQWQQELINSSKSPNTIKTQTAIIKSLFSFAHKCSLLKANPAVALRSPKGRDALNQRILSELQIASMIALETNPRNHAILRVLYGAGVRVSELSGLTWGDLIERPSHSQLTVTGKGSKSRSVLIKPDLHQELLLLKADDDTPDSPIFKSRHGGKPISRIQTWRIVNEAAKRVGIDKVSPHWLRHAHASHSLDRGAPIHLVQQTLGHASVATTGRYLHARPTDSSSLYLP
jgi:integrase/recombinase XerD